MKIDFSVLWTARAVVVCLFLVSGCNASPTKPKRFADIVAGGTTGFFSDGLTFTNKNAKSLRSIDVKITVYREQSSVEIERHWAAWHSGEVQNVDAPNSGGSLQRIHMVGKAELGAERDPVEIDAEFLFEKPRTK